MNAAESRPRLLAGCDIRKLPIGPTEAFVLSRVDGSSRDTDIASGTGLPVAEVRAILQKLVDLGAITLGESSAAATPPGPATVTPPTARAPSPSPSPSPSPVPSPGPSPSPSPVPRVDPSYDPALLDEPGELTPEEKAEILDLWARIDQSDHYQFLGVARTADKKEIKGAYFALVNKFHADRFFGKDLGPFKSRLDRVFGALTKAHDVLTRAKARAEYDAYLASREATLGARDSIRPRPAPNHGGVIEEFGPRIPRAPKVPERAAPMPTAETPAGVRILSAEPEEDSRSPSPSDPVRHEPHTSIQVSGRPPSDDAARRLMARKLRGEFGQRVTPTDSLTPPLSRDDVKRAVMDDLRTRLDNKAAVSPGRKFRLLADEAEASGNWASAVNALKMAADLDPDDHTLAVRIERAQLEADRALADKFLEQGKYEERDREYDRAARSYERAARGKESAEIYAKAAECKLRAGSDGRKAVELARSAVALRPEVAQHRLVLARAYEAVGMLTSAQGEAKRALELDPKNEEAKALVRDLKK